MSAAEQEPTLEADAAHAALLDAAEAYTAAADKWLVEQYADPDAAIDRLEAARTALCHAARDYAAAARAERDALPPENDGDA